MARSRFGEGFGNNRVTHNWEFANFVRMERHGFADAKSAKHCFAPLASQADGRVTFVWETKVTKNSCKDAARPQDCLDSRLNGDTAVAFVMVRSRLGGDFGTCGVAYSYEFVVPLAGQGSDLLANPPDRRLFDSLMAELPTDGFARQTTSF